jgi:hypothetical protein
MNTPTCKDRINQELKDRISDLKKLWSLYQSGDENGDPELGQFNEYGLCFDYVAPGTFNGQRNGYFRYQLSYGGPSDEFRFFVDNAGKLYKIEYWFLDWYDGSCKKLTGSNYELMEEIYNFFDECRSTEAEFNKAMKE